MVKSRALNCIMYMNALSYLREGKILVTGHSALSVFNGRKRVAMPSQDEGLRKREEE
jgi:hypothetical protein